MDISTVAARIKALRQAMDKTQAEIAAATGIPLPTWKKYETGDREPGAASLVAMATTGVDLHWLLTGEGDLWRQNSYSLLPDILERIKNKAPAPKGKKKYAAATATKLNAAEPTADVNVELLAAVIDSVEKTERHSGGRLAPAQKIELISSLYLKVQSAPL
ncbi:MAG TPA: helix-turn-helix transcriptional regulator [Rhodocyclaceae bacterium]|jgi:transcriptional regulator with XRE-family HTH domain|nr:helix-turn-helix transcriptional regulator [Rhodocyclaceae bacterium]